MRRSNFRASDGDGGSWGLLAPGKCRHCSWCGRELCGPGRLDGDQYRPVRHQRWERGSQPGHCDHGFPSWRRDATVRDRAADCRCGSGRSHHGLQCCGGSAIHAKSHWSGSRRSYPPAGRLFLLGRSRPDGNADPQRSGRPERAIGAASRSGFLRSSWNPPKSAQLRLCRVERAWWAFRISSNIQTTHTRR